MLDEKKGTSCEREAILYLITVLVEGESEGVFSPEVKDCASQLWETLENEGYIAPKEKLNKLLDMLAEKSLQDHFSLQGKPWGETGT